MSEGAKIWYTGRVKSAKIRDQFVDDDGATTPRHCSVQLMMAGKFCTDTVKVRVREEDLGKCPPGAAVEIVAPAEVMQKENWHVCKILKGTFSAFGQVTKTDAEASSERRAAA